MNKSYVVLDSGIFLATIMNEPFTSNSKRLIADLVLANMQIVVPALFHYKVVATLRKWLYRGMISLPDAIFAREELLTRTLIYILDFSLLRRAFDLATQYNRPTAYDSQYLAVAERYNCEFWTADEKLYNAIRQQNPYIRWIGNY